MELKELISKAEVKKTLAYENYQKQDNLITGAMTYYMDMTNAFLDLIEELKKLNTLDDSNCNLDYSNCNLDYSLKKRENVWFTFKTHPKKEDWIQAEILDLNWAYKSAAIKLEGYKDVFSTGIKSLHRDKHYC